MQKGNLTGLRFPTAVLTAAIVFGASGAVTAAEVAGYLTLTTDYVKRGVTQTNGNPAVQLGADVNFASGFYFGVWGSTLDFDSTPTRQRDLEVNYYGGYSHELTDTWQIGVRAVAYRYPGQKGNFDYNYEEYSVSGNYNDRFWLDYTYIPDLYHSGRSSEIVEIYSEWPLNSRWAIGGGGGRFDASSIIGRSYAYWQLGITASFRFGDVDLRYHDTNDWVPILSSPARAKSRVALKIQIPF